MEKDEAEQYAFGDKVLRQMRVDAGLSQMQLANKMMLHESTIHKWESGESCPSAIWAWKWYNACGINHMPYVMSWQHPERYSTDERQTNVALHEAIMALDLEDRKRLLYAITGNHGSFFPGVLQLILAHLHLPLKGRIGSATLVATHYNIANRKGTLVHTDRPMPNMDLLDRSIHAGMEACFDDRESYTL